MRSVPATICRRSSCLHTTSTHGVAGTSPSPGCPPGLHSARHSLAALYQNRSMLYLGAAGNAPHGEPPHRIGVQVPPVPGHARGKRARRAMAAPAHHPQGAAESEIRQPRRQTGRTGLMAQKGQEGLAPQTRTECPAPLLFSAPPPAAVARWCRRCAAAAAATGFASSRHWCGWPGR